MQTLFFVWFWNDKKPVLKRVSWIHWFEQYCKWGSHSEWEWYPADPCKYTVYCAAIFGANIKSEWVERLRHVNDLFGEYRKNTIWISWLIDMYKYSDGSQCFVTSKCRLWRVQSGRAFIYFITNFRTTKTDFNFSSVSGWKIKIVEYTYTYLATI